MISTMVRAAIWILLAASALAQAPTSSSLEGFLKTYCASCHQGSDAEGGLIVPKERFTPEEHRRILTRVKSGVMPPKKALQPSALERANAISDLESSRPVVAEDPGRTTMRRLSRVEYAHVVRDLLGVTIDAEEELLPDDLGYGFDAIGDVLTLSPLHLERYAELAEKIAALALVDEDPANPPTLRLEAESLEGTTGQEGGDIYNLWSNGTIGDQVKLPRAGTYEVRVRAFAQQAGPDPARMAIELGGRSVFEHEVKAVRRAPEVYTTKVAIESSEVRLAVAFTNDYYEPDAPKGTPNDRNLLVDWIEVRGPLDARAPTLAERWIATLDPKKGAPEVRARPILKAVASRAWRRPATDDEVGRLVRLVKESASRGESFTSSLQWALSAILVSPHFLFRPEVSKAEKGKEVRDLGDYELASRLSFFLWSSLPDEELTKMAAERKLKDAVVLEAQVRRMLRDPKAQSLSTHFAAQWLELRSLDEVTPAVDRFPQWDNDLKTSLRTETERFFAWVLAEGRPLVELIDSKITFVDARLAAHYGLPAPSGDGFHRVELPDARRGGVLFHGSVQTVTSNPTRTSPVKRGKWILDNLLDDPPPPPPPGVGALEEKAEATEGATLRDRLLAHRKDEQCASCHARMDALGFALENFDPIGRWRERDGKAPIDATAVLPDGRTLNSAAELKAWLLEDRAFVRCLAKKLLIFAIGRGPLSGDDPALDRLAQAYDPRIATLEDLILGIVRLDAFRRTRL